MPKPSIPGRSLRIAIAVAAGALLLALIAVAWRALDPPWRDIQRKAYPADPPGVVEIAACAGTLDRCATCHADHDAPLGPPRCRAAETLQAQHPPGRFGCSACHGGTARALSPEIAHRMPGTREKDPLLTPPHLEASCGRCHVPARRPGMERLYAGAMKFLELGCLLCHPLEKQGRGSWDFGPDLRALGRLSPRYLGDALLEPTKNFAGSSMPSFAPALADDPAALEALVIFLESLALPRPRECNQRIRADGLLALSCGACHAGEGGAARGAFAHRCDYILHNASRFSCRACHEKTVPAGSSDACPLLSQERKNCAVCHDEPAGGRP